MSIKYSSDELEKLPVKKLEAMAMKFNWKVISKIADGCYYEDDDVRELQGILYTRQFKLDTSFRWTKDNIDRLLKLNEQIMAAMEKGKQEMRQILAQLEQRKKNKDKFLSDYELDVQIDPLIYYDEGNKNSFHKFYEKVLCFILPRHLFLTFSYRELPDKENIHSDKALSWNIEGLDRAELANHYICHGMHELCGHTLWSLPDILKINRLWIDVIARYQHEGKEF